MSQQGVATFFCCGDNTGWGEWCGSAGQGWCNAPAFGNIFCDNSGIQMAYPKLAGSGSYQCDWAGCNVTVPTHSCGDSIRIVGDCSGNEAWPTIVDCGPQMNNNCNLSSPYDCINRQMLLVDLTPASYYWLSGGRGDIGPLAVTVYW